MHTYIAYIMSMPKPKDQVSTRQDIIRRGIGQGQCFQKEEEKIQTKKAAYIICIICIAAAPEMGGLCGACDQESALHEERII